MVELLPGKFLNGHRASFVRSEGELFVVNVSGRERTISRDSWRSLHEQDVHAKDRVEYLDGGGERAIF